MMNSWYGQSFGLSPASFLGLGIIALIIGLIVVILKGYSLWYAARRGETIWFIILLVVNTVGILELIYLIVVVGLWKNNNHPSISTTTSTPTDSTKPQV